MELKECDTPEKLADFLQKCGISSTVTDILVEGETGGEEFLDFTQEDLLRLKIKTGPIKKLLKIKKKYNNDQEIPATTTQQPQIPSPHPTAGVQSTIQKFQTHDLQMHPMAKSQSIPRSSVQTVQQSEKVPQALPTQPESLQKDTPLYKKLQGCTAIKSEPGPPQVFQIPLKDYKMIGNCVALCQVGATLSKSESHMAPPHRYVMVVGETGAGKTTLINGMANYLLGTEWNDNFRFKLVSYDEEGGKNAAKSKTKHVTAYEFPWQKGSKVPYTLTVIDTPGFGDTGVQHLKKDEENVEKIRKLFMSRCVDQIDAIGFVAQSGAARLTATQRYIFNAILSIFGKDIGDNIFLMTTFADASRPLVLDAVNESKIKIQKHFKFNNSALDANNIDDDSEEGSFNEMFWKMGMKSFTAFFNHLSTVQSKSLIQTREVLVEREHLQTLVEGLRPQILFGLTKMNELRQEEAIVQQHEVAILQSKNFRYTVVVQRQRVINLEGKGIMTTNCLQCSFTCHKECAYKDDADKKNCSSMDPNGYCKACPKKCKWDQHRNTPYHHEWYTDVETRKSEDLEARFYTAQTDKSKVEQIMDSLEQHLIETRQVVLQMICQTKKCLDRLKEIALKPNPLTEVEYIDMLIQNEENECEEGFLVRMEALKELRKQAELLSDMTEVEIQDFMKAGHKEFFRQFCQPKPAEIQNYKQTTVSVITNVKNYFYSRQ